MSNPHAVTKEFEQALCAYTGARFAVTTTSCTMALLLAVAWHTRSPFGFVRDDLDRKLISIPKRTYISVPISIIHAGGQPVFHDEDWSGSYQLRPMAVYDCARRFTSGMYVPGQFQCCSFHVSKILGDTQGGAILHDNPEADVWLRKARFDGRTEGVHPLYDKFDVLGYHCYLSPDVAARLLWKLSVLPKHNADLPNSDYPDLSQMAIFQ